MKKLTFLIVICIALINSANAQIFDKLKNEASKVIKGVGSGTANIPFSKEEAARAIKEALAQGTNKTTDIVSRLDGYYKNPEIKIPFPKEAGKVESTLRQMGLGNKVDEVVLSLNRAAESAAKSAADIFLAAITEMTIDDAIGIVKGDTNSATKYLQRKTTAKLSKKFKPVVKNALDAVDATKYWADIMNIYNKIPFVKKINPDLAQYVTDKAIEGIFIMIAKEEVNIRKDPVARTTELLKKVFGN